MMEFDTVLSMRLDFAELKKQPNIRHDLLSDYFAREFVVIFYQNIQSSLAELNLKSVVLNSEDKIHTYYFYPEDRSHANTELFARLFKETLSLCAQMQDFYHFQDYHSNHKDYFRTMIHYLELNHGLPDTGIVSHKPKI